MAVSLIGLFVVQNLDPMCLFFPQKRSRKGQSRMLIHNEKRQTYIYKTALTLINDSAKVKKIYVIFVVTWHVHICAVFSTVNNKISTQRSEIYTTYANTMQQMYQGTLHIGSELFICTCDFTSFFSCDKTFSLIAEDEKSSWNHTQINSQTWL